MPSEKLRDYFSNDYTKVPTHGVSVGLRTIFESKELLFVVFGESKSKIVKVLLGAHKFNPEYPVTFLHEAKNKTVLYLDEAAAR